MAFPCEGMRAVLVCDTTEQLCEDVNASQWAIEERPTTQVLAFFFPELSGWKGMLQQLYDGNWVFHEVLNICSRELKPHLGGLLLTDALYGACELSGSLKQVAACAVQVSLTCLWLSWGIPISNFSGHGKGELVVRVLQGSSILELLSEEKHGSRPSVGPSQKTKPFVICVGPSSAAKGLEPAVSAMSCLAPREQGARSLCKALGKWWVSGGHVDWDRYYSSFKGACSPVRLPAYPFHRVGVEQFQSSQPHGPVDSSLPFALCKPKPGDLEDMPPNLLACVGHVLAVEAVDLDPETSFLENGGDSQSLPHMQQSLFKTFGVKVTQEDLMNLPLSQLLGLKELECEVDRSLTCCEADRYQAFPLTPIQEAYVWGRAVSGVSAHGYLEVDVHADFDLSAFESSFSAMIRRHDMLRMELIRDSAGNYLQRIRAPEATGCAFQCDIIDLTSIDPSTSLTLQLQELRQQYSHEVIEMEGDSLFRIRVSKCHDIEGHVWWRLHFSFDSLVLDMFSMRILFAEWHALYTGEPEKPRLQLNFRDWVMWSQKQASTPQYLKAKSYWEQRYQQMPGAPALHLLRRPEGLKECRFQRCIDFVDQETWSHLKVLAKQFGLTSTSVVLTLFAAVLGRWSQTQDFLISLTTFDRDSMLHSEMGDIVGDFTSVILLEVHTSLFGHEPLKASVEKVLKQLNDDLRHKQYDGVKVQRELIRSQTSLVAPIVFTSLLNLPFSDSSESVGQHFGDVAFSITQTPQVWLDCKVFEAAERLAIEWDFVEEILPADHVHGMHEAFCRLVKLTGRHFDAHSAIPEVLGDADLSAWRTFNRTSRAWEQTCPRTLQELVRQGLSQRDAAALIWDSPVSGKLCNLSAVALRHHVQQLCNLLRPHINANDIVALHMPRSPGLVVAIYSVIEAGGAYLPLDVDQPLKRKQLMLTDSGSKALIYSSDSLGFEGVCLQQGAEVDSSASISGHFAVSPVAPDDLAYVIYTSGSTGPPKGVAVPHKAVMNRLAWMQETYTLKTEDVIMQKTSYSFDVSVWEFFWPLFGATLFVAQPDLQASPEYLQVQIGQHRISILHFVPGLLRDFVEQPCAVSDLSSLRHVFCSGEALHPDVVRKAYQVLPQHTEIHNLYGPTEAAIDVTFWPCPRSPIDMTFIGTPIANMQVFILNAGQLCPPGVVGELHLAGIGLAKGYLQKEDQMLMQHIYQRYNEY